MEAMVYRLSKRIRVVYYIQSRTYGGAEKVVVQELYHLDPQRFELILVCPPELYEQLRPELPEATRFVALSYRSNFMNSIFEPLRTLSLARLFRCLNADILHLHNLPAKYTGRAANLLARIPAVVVTEHLALQLAPDTVKPGRLAWYRARLLWEFFHAADRFLMRQTDCVIGTSGAVREYVINGIGVPDTKLKALHPGLDLDQFPFAPRSSNHLREELDIDTDSYLLTTIARLDPAKGHAFLLEAMPKVLEHYPSAVLAIAGEGTEKNRLLEMAQALGVQKNVRFLGFRSDIQRILACADLCILPTLSEALGITLIEAMAVGVPCIASEVGGIPEVIADGKTGYLVPPRNAEALADAIIRALSSPERLAAIREAARKQVEDHFDAEKRAQELMVIFEDLARSKGAR